MIKSARQLKDKIKNLANGDSKKAQLLTRKYMMERFLARIAASKYRNHFILKGGMLLSAIVGEDARSTKDIDTTVLSLPLTEMGINQVIKEIASADLEDNLTFEITNTEEIMEEHDYPGVRITMKVLLEQLRETVTVDISTGDEITPSAIEFSYPMMFDDECINIWSYNLETLLAEKIETILARSTANTRMRDFYDIHTLCTYETDLIDFELLRDAYYATAKKRGTDYLIEDAEQIMFDITSSQHMRLQWNNYRNSTDYVGTLEWDEVLETVNRIVLDDTPLSEGFGFSMV